MFLVSSELLVLGCLLYRYKQRASRVVQIGGCLCLYFLGSPLFLKDCCYLVCGSRESANKYCIFIIEPHRDLGLSAFGLWHVSLCADATEANMCAGSSMFRSVLYLTQIVFAGLAAASKLCSTVSLKF